MKIYRIILILLLAIVPSVCLAQTSLVKVLDSLEDSDKVRDVIYQEKRDPKTRKIYECKRIFTFTDQKLARRIIDAFKKERPNSVNYQINVDNNSTGPTDKFIDKMNAMTMGQLALQPITNGQGCRRLSGHAIHAYD